MFGDYSTQCAFVSTFADFVNNKVTDLQSYLSDVTSFGQAVCALFAVFYVGNIVWKSWVSGQSIDIYASFKPIVISFLIINFSLVTAFVELLAGGLTAATQDFVDKVAQKSITYRTDVKDQVTTINMSSNYSAITTDNVEEVVNNGEGENKTSMDVDAKEVSIWDIMNGGSWYDIVFGILEAVTNEICSLLASLVSCCILMLSFVYRCMLSFFGPFIFALALLPSSEGVIIGFCKKYFTYCLFPAMINIVNGVLCYGQVCIGTALSSDAALADGAGAWVAYLSTSLIAVIAVFMYGSVPGLASTITDVVVDRGISNSVMAPASVAAGAGVSAAGKSSVGQAVMGSAGKVGAFMATGGASSLLTAGKMGLNAVKKMRSRAANDSNMKNNKS